MSESDPVMADFEAPLFGESGSDPLSRAQWSRTDHGAARRLVALHGPDLMAVNGERWAVWDGKRFDTVRGHSLAMRRAQLLEEAVLDEAAALQR